MRVARAFAVALLAATPGWAAGEWTTIGSSEALVVEIDPELVRVQGDLAMAWTRTTFTVPRRIEGDADVKQLSAMQLHAIDCAAGASTIVGIISYTGPHGRGETIERTVRPRPEWNPRPAPPGSIADATIRLACAELARRGPQ